MLYIILVPKIGDIPQPTIDYEKLRMLCSIEGLKGRYGHILLNLSKILIGTYLHCRSKCHSKVKFYWKYCSLSSRIKVSDIPFSHVFLFCPDDDAPALKASCSSALISRASDLVCLVETIYHVLPSPGSLCIYPVQIRYFNSSFLTLCCLKVSM